MEFDKVRGKIRTDEELNDLVRGMYSGDENYDKFLARLSRTVRIGTDVIANAITRVCKVDFASRRVTGVRPPEPPPIQEL